MGIRDLNLNCGVVVADLIVNTECKWHWGHQLFDKICRDGGLLGNLYKQIFWTQRIESLYCWKGLKGIMGNWKEKNDFLDYKNLAVYFDLKLICEVVCQN